MAIGPMVPLTTAANGFAARVLAAHLGAEGIVWELRGNVDGPYPVGPVEVLVSQDDLVLAREVLAEPAGAGKPDLALDLEPEGEREAADGAQASAVGRTSRQVWLLVGGLVLVTAVLLGRLLVLAGH